MTNAPTKRRRRRQKPTLRFTSTVPWAERGDDAPMMVGYVRVSTDDQDTQRQVDELVKAGVHTDDIWGDKASGSTMDRQGWKYCLMALQTGDILVIHSLDRLSRDTFDTLATLRELADRGVKVRVLNMDLNTDTPIGRFSITIFSAFSQLERDMALDRTRSGLARARERGIIGGASRQFSDEAVAEAFRIEGTQEKAAKRLGCSRITVVRGLARIKAKEKADE